MSGRARPNHHITTLRRGATCIREKNISSRPPRRPRGNTRGCVTLLTDVLRWIRCPLPARHTFGVHQVHLLGGDLPQVGHWAARRARPADDMQSAVRANHRILWHCEALRVRQPELHDVRRLQAASTSCATAAAAATTVTISALTLAWAFTATASAFSVAIATATTAGAASASALAAKRVVSLLRWPGRRFRRATCAWPRITAAHPIALALAPAREGARPGWQFEADF